MKSIYAVLAWLLVFLVDVASLERYISFDKSRLDASSFLEQFDYKYLNETNWQVSHGKKDNKTFYKGVWSIEEPQIYPGLTGDKGLVLKTPAAFHAISHKFAKPFNATDNDLVLQYEVKCQNGLSCGGSYIKLLEGDFDPEVFSSATPYRIMFGPDKCGSSDKSQLVVKRFDEKAGNYKESLLKFPPVSIAGDITTLYTLIIKKNFDIEIRYDGKVAMAGNLMNDRELMEPYLFLENSNVAKYIANPDATKPAIWNDEEDGPWIPPNIANPNHNQPKKNPLSGQISGLGFELWSMDRNILIDNIYLGHSVEEAELIGNETFIPKVNVENIMYEKYKPTPKHGPIAPPPLSFDELIEQDSLPSLQDLKNIAVFLFHQQRDLFFDYWKDVKVNPTGTIKANPLMFILYVCFILTIFLYCFVFSAALFIVLKNFLSQNVKVAPQEKPHGENLEDEKSMNDQPVAATGVDVNDNHYARKRH